MPNDKSQTTDNRLHALKMAIKIGQSPTTKHPLSDLAFLREEQRIGGDSNWWPRIQKWQREGLVRLRWGNTGMECFVRLTDAGKERVKDVPA